MKQPTADREDVVGAIRRVLDSEREATAALAACERQARDLLGEARERARVIRQRADARAKAVHRHCERCLDEALAALAQRRQNLDTATELSDSESERLDGAVRALVDELLGSR